ncbi:hypothetical protein MAINES_00080 [Brevundimonas phage vB_BpoS-MaInes]|nr:hypothetical protein MAINES_00080 [Brevundimonas phage vB_BpoS-MaInes]
MAREDYVAKQAERDAKEARREQALDGILNVVEKLFMGKAYIRVEQSDSTKTYRIVQDKA